jgi:hypothetical protein
VTWRKLRAKRGACSNLTCVCEFVFAAPQLKPVAAVIKVLPAVRLGSKNDNDFGSQD